ncbi:hypothetical protein C7Y70_14735 [Pseudoalteromonas sp. KS88]|nr:hypothetical protein C7Y70_14735 [Pseudoalteromonas sp. KS88]
MCIPVDYSYQVGGMTSDQKIDYTGTNASFNLHLFNFCAFFKYKLLDFYVNRHGLMVSFKVRSSDKLKIRWQRIEKLNSASFVCVTF